LGGSIPFAAAKGSSNLRDTYVNRVGNHTNNSDVIIADATAALIRESTTAKAAE